MKSFFFNVDTIKLNFDVPQDELMFVTVVLFSDCFYATVFFRSFLPYFKNV